MKRIIVIILLVSLAVIVIALFIRSAESSNYYKYRDLAVALCKSGDIDTAYRHIETALQYAKDQDLIGEGLHYKLLFAHNACDE